MAEKMPSSVKLGARPMISRIRSYSSGVRPWDAINSGVMAGSVMSVALSPLGARARLTAVYGRPRAGERVCVLSERSAKGQGCGAVVAGMGEDAGLMKSKTCECGVVFDQFYPRVQLQHVMAERARAGRGGVD